MNTIKRIMLIAIAFVFATLSLQSAFAYSYGGYGGCYGGCGGAPIYQAGYWHNSYSYGWSGWGYNRVYYNYHYPYNTYNYYRYPSYGYGGMWNRYYMYNVYPVAVAYPFPGYYW